MESAVTLIQEVGFPIAAALGLGWFIYKLIMRIVDGMETKLDIVDENTPPSIAAGSIYLVLSLCSINMNKKHISQACKISEVTISKCYKKLYEYRYQIIPQLAIDKYNKRQES